MPPPHEPTTAMVAAGVKAGFLVRDPEKPHWLLTPQELEGIIRRAYIAMEETRVASDNEPKTPPATTDQPPEGQFGA